ncbi:MAG: gfo/Idh/MocA family oxidoreductase [Sphingobacteriales bacterium]|nr:MAG: gfo/Idh/MocA family oxidoreductase [Sphingobacteriales bacterium]
MNKVKWAVLGCGRIAGKFAADLQLVQDAELFAVASRDIEKAKHFALQYPAKHVYGSYEELVRNTEIDVIYVATPHSHHHEHTLICLRHNKAVLCEKAFAINGAQVREMVTEARNRKLFLMEAMWTKFLPHYNKVRSMIADGKLGELQSIQVNFGFLPPQPPAQRIFDPALGGGTLLDIGIYNVFLVQSILGKPDHIQAIMKRASSGVDEQLAVQFQYNNGIVAQLLSSFTSNLQTDANIAGNSGRIRLTSRFYEPSATIEYYPERVDSIQIIPIEKQAGWGYHHQIRHVQECLRQGLTESPVMTHKDSLGLMETMDSIRREVGLKYPADC